MAAAAAARASRLVRFADGRSGAARRIRLPARAVPRPDGAAPAGAGRDRARGPRRRTFPSASPRIWGGQPFFRDDGPAGPGAAPRRRMSGEMPMGTDLLADSLAHGPRRKIVLESYAPSGIDVKGLATAGEDPAEGASAGEDVTVHMHGSVIAFPDACFLWGVRSPADVTLESLSAVRLYAPGVEYLFVGCDGPLPHGEFERTRRELRRRGIVVDRMDVMNAMGTFNILNGEDRRVACALVIDPGD